MYLLHWGTRSLNEILTSLASLAQSSVTKELMQNIQGPGYLRVHFGNTGTAFTREIRHLQRPPNLPPDSMIKDKLLKRVSIVKD